MGDPVALWWWPSRPTILLEGWSGGADLCGCVVVSDVTTTSPAFIKMPGADSLFAACWHPTDLAVVVGSSSQAAIVDCSRMRSTNVWTPPSDVMSVACDGRRAFLGCRSGAVLAVDARDRPARATPFAALPTTVTAVATGVAGPHGVLVADTGRCMRLYDVRAPTHPVVPVFAGYENNYRRLPVVVDAGSRAVFAITPSLDGLHDPHGRFVRCWDAAAGELVAEWGARPAAKGVDEATWSARCLDVAAARGQQPPVVVVGAASWLTTFAHTQR